MHLCAHINCMLITARLVAFKVPVLHVRTFVFVLLPEYCLDNYVVHSVRMCICDTCALYL